MDYISRYKKVDKYMNLSITKSSTLAQTKEFYSLLLSCGNDNTVVCITPKVTQKESIATNSKSHVNSHLTPDSCVELCRNVLGLKVNEIAKIIGISRATLDLHRKGANVKDKELLRYQQLNNFVFNIEQIYGNSLKKGMRNVLIEKKTLVQHIIEHADNLDNVMNLVDHASEIVGAVKVDNNAVSPLKLQSRLVGIGKFA
ncbi:hypothetical protein [Vibrio diabolicus]|uniref:hypothetical protein n=1 Tax=Vibrio harveyi group TaxID=717610 RepID=UPI00193EE1C1|nr:hypothetical protein [Vibrio parahaemolyticus]